MALIVNFRFSTAKLRSVVIWSILVSCLFYFFYELFVVWHIELRNAPYKNVDTSFPEAIDKT